MGLGELRVELNGALQQRTRFLVGSLASSPLQLSPAKIVIVGLEIVGASARDAPPLALAELYRQGRDDLSRHLILHGEDVGQVAVVPFGPEVATGRAVDQLSGDPYL